MPEKAQNADHEFVSEPVTPDRGTFEAAAMARGQPGLPAGFTWRGRRYTIDRLLEAWKHTELDKHRSGERYYRKHYYRIRTDTGEIMTLYAVRHLKHGESPRNRWWLYTVENPGEGRPPPH